MFLINCPNIPAPELGVYRKWAFLAGGITNCEDWQNYAIDKLNSEEGLVLLNPRRVDFDTSNLQDEAFQIQWEHERLVEATYCLFWFPPETLCPITLFELGKWLGWGKRGLVVGCHPDYKRRRDVVHQTQLMRPGFVVYSSLDDTINALKEKMK